MRNLGVIGSLVLAAVIAAGQDPGGSSVVGRVTDFSGAVIPYAQVELLEPVHLNTTADGLGAFRFDHLAAGEYSVSATQKGFFPSTFKNIKVAANETKRTADLILMIGACGSEAPIFIASDRIDLGGIKGTLFILHYGETKGSAVSERQVVLRSETADLVRSGTTSANGEFSFKDLPSGRFRIEVGQEQVGTEWAVPGWIRLRDVSLSSPVCPEDGCDATHPPRQTQIVLCG